VYSFGEEDTKIFHPTMLVNDKPTAISAILADTSSSVE
jgi:hypothetical protein